MDCRTARQLLDCLHQESSVPLDSPLDEVTGNSYRDLLNHLDACPDCKHSIDEWRHFDRRLYSMLLSTEVPPGLEDRLLQNLSADLATITRVATPVKPASRFLRIRNWKVWSIALVFALLVSGTWIALRPSNELLNFSGAGELLAARFLKSAHALDELEEFDGSFDLGSYRTDLQQLSLSAPRGIDLGGGRGQDAAVFHFGLKSWGGVLTVLPTQHFTGMPDVSIPSVQSGRSVLQWRSSDGKLTYICFVHQGSAAALARELFGLLT